MLVFIIQSFLISLTGVMAPGPVTTSALGMGVRNRCAGTLMGFGHCLVELPLVLVLMLGVGTFFESKTIQMWIGLLGGAFIIFMAIQMVSDIKKVGQLDKTPKTDRPIIAGIILSLGNPYFILWWVAVWLNIIRDAQQLGAWGLVIFGAIHWSCDVIWLSILSWTSFKGTHMLGLKGQKVLLGICSAALVVFGARFIFNAGKILFS